MKVLILLFFSCSLALSQEAGDALNNKLFQQVASHAHLLPENYLAGKRSLTPIPNKPDYRLTSQNLVWEPKTTGTGNLIYEARFDKGGYSLRPRYDRIGCCSIGERVVGMLVQEFTYRPTEVYPDEFLKDYPAANVLYGGPMSRRTDPIKELERGLKRALWQEFGPDLRKRFLRFMPKLLRPVPPGL